MTGAGAGAGAGFVWQVGLVVGLQVGWALGCSGCLGLGLGVPVPHVLTVWVWGQQFQSPMFLGIQPP